MPGIQNWGREMLKGRHDWGTDVVDALAEYVYLAGLSFWAHKHNTYKSTADTRHEEGG